MLNFTVSGEGIPVVFLHGYMEDSSMWKFITDSPGMKAICIDLNGHGNSEFTEMEPSIAFMAEQVLDIIHHLGLQQPQIVGHSLGGYVALELFKQLPTLEHITLLHSHPKADSEQKKGDRLRVAELVKTKAGTFIQEAIPNLFHEPGRHKTTIQHYCDIAKRMDPEAIGWTALAMRNRPDSTVLLEQFPDRFSIIQGRFDNLIQAEEMKDLAEKTGVSYIELPNSGHMGHEEETMLCKEVLLSIIV